MKINCGATANTHRADLDLAIDLVWFSNSLCLCLWLSVCLSVSLSLSLSVCLSLSPENSDACLSYFAFILTLFVSLWGFMTGIYCLICIIFWPQIFASWFAVSSAAMFAILFADVCIYHRHLPDVCMSDSVMALYSVCRCVHLPWAHLPAGRSMGWWLFLHLWMHWQHAGKIPLQREVLLSWEHHCLQLLIYKPWKWCCSEPVHVFWSQ